VAAQHHLIGGFNRRLLMLATSRRVIEEITHSPTDKPIGVYRAIDLAIQLNAYYLHLCGALDNLAWAMQYEWNLIPGVTEIGKGRQKIGLFARSFTDALVKSQPSLWSALETHRDWYTDLRDLRDPGAHRVPLYAIPGIMNEADAEEHQRLSSLATDRGKAGDHHGMMELIHQASNLGGYAPYMSIWTPDGERLVDAWAYVLRDHRTFQQVADLLSTMLLPVTRQADDR